MLQEVIVFLFSTLPFIRSSLHDTPISIHEWNDARSLQSTPSNSCKVSSTPSLVQLVTNGILKEERDDVVLDGIGKLSNIAITKLDVGSFTISKGGRDDDDSSHLRVEGNNLFVESQFHYDIRQSYYVDGGEGSSTLRGPYSIDFGQGNDVQCDFSRLDYQMDLQSGDPLLGALTAAGSNDRKASGKGSHSLIHLSIQGEISQLVARMLCDQVLKKVTGQNLVPSSNPSTSLMSWYSSGFHYIFLAVGLLGGFGIGNLVYWLVVERMMKGGGKKRAVFAAAVGEGRT